MNGTVKRNIMKKYLNKQLINGEIIILPLYTRVSTDDEGKKISTFTKENSQLNQKTVPTNPVFPDYPGCHRYH